MTIENYYVSHLLKDISSAKTYKFFENFSSFDSKNISSREFLDFELKDRIQNKKIPPILELARQKDAKEIVKIYRNLYYGTYPYREMEDELEVKKMINNPSIQWIIFKAPSRQIIGCITFVLDFFNKRGYIRGFMLKKKCQGRIDVVKAMIGSMIGMCCSFKEKILSWYVENRTAHTSSQYPMYRCGIEP
ncbi:MAG: GNAT family N-acetyltransferase, partial [Promethearchaeota archaeon]